MEDAKRSILDRVVAGTITPEEAAAQLDRLEAATAPFSIPVATAESPDPGEEPRVSDLAVVRVVNQMGSVMVIGDASVQDVVAEGPHVARREGRTMIIEVEPLGSHGGFRFGHVGIELGDGRRLVVRMNPALALDAEVQAGSLKVHHVAGPIRAVVQAGSTNIEDCTGPYDIIVSAGSFKARTRVATGESKIRCEAGSVKIHLLEGSSCRINAQTTMGKIVLPGGRGSSPGFGDHDEVTIGGGAANLDIRSTMGSVLVSSDQ